jgi:hypothetical protein
MWMFTSLRLIYSASSSGPPAAEGYFARGWFTLLAILVLLQRKVTFFWGEGGGVYSASRSGPPAAKGYFTGSCFTSLVVLILLQ